MRKLAVNLLLALGCIAVLLVVTELVLRARWEPRVRTLGANVHTRTTTAEYDVAIDTNREGFRDVDHPLAGPQIAVIGDSFVFGSGVAFEGGVTARTQALLAGRSKPAEVHNFGVPGTGPHNALRIWRAYARDLHPHMVIVCLYAGNDAGDALRESREHRPRFVTIARAKMLWFVLRARTHGSTTPAAAPVPAGGWDAFGVDNPATMDALFAAAKSRGVPEDSVRARVAAIPDSLVADARAFRSNPFNLAEAVLDPDGLRHNLLLDTLEMQRGWDALESALRDLHHEVDAAGSKLLLVVIPAAVQVDRGYWWAKNLGVRLDRRVLDTPEFQRRLSAFCTAEGIADLDLLPLMRTHPDRVLYYLQDGHWTGAGHDLAAQAIAERIAAEDRSR